MDGEMVTAYQPPPDDPTDRAYWERQQAIQRILAERQANTS